MLRSLTCEAPRRRGVAYVLAILFLTVFTTLGMAFSSMTSLELSKSANARHVMKAKLAAESGLEFMLLRVGNLLLPHDTTEANLLSNLSVALSEELDYTPNLTGAGITSTSTARPFCASASR